MNRLLPLLLLLPAVLTACNAAPAGKHADASSAPVDSFPLPSVPADITVPAQRAAYAASHFWDNAVLPDSATAGLEQAMANFGAMASMVTDTLTLDDAARRMLDAAKGSPAKLYALLEVAERYFYDPESPMRDEEIFIAVMRAAPADERRAELLADALLNRRGTRAADFVMTTSAGRATTLAAEVAKAPQTLVYFFDTECPVCRSLIPKVDELAKANGLPVVAVAPEDNAGNMEQELPLFPHDWTVAADRGQIDGERLYVFPALPAVYIVDSDMTVLAKDLPVR